MTGFNQLEYYARREKQEREAATRAVVPAVKAAHAEMAHAYTRLIAKTIMLHLGAGSALDVGISGRQALPVSQQTALEAERRISV
jgi:hypothetical protein